MNIVINAVLWMDILFSWRFFWSYVYVYIVYRRGEHNLYLKKRKGFIKVR